MKISKTIRPTRITGNSKEDIYRKIGALGYTSSKHFSGKTNSMSVGIDKSRMVVFGINLEKRRPVKKQSPKATFKGKNGNVRKTKIVEEGHWVAHYYRFPVSLLEALNLKLVQNSRTFTITEL